MAKKKILVIGGPNLKKGQRTFYRRKYSDPAKKIVDAGNGPVTAPFGMRIDVELTTNSAELVKRGFASIVEEDGQPHR